MHPVPGPEVGQLESQHSGLFIQRLSLELRYRHCLRRI